MEYSKNRLYFICEKEDMHGVHPLIPRTLLSFLDDKYMKIMV